MSPSPTPPATPRAFSAKAPRQPMLWASVAYSAGIVAGVYLWRPALWWIVAGAAFIAAAAYFVQRRAALGWTIALAALFLAGALHIQLRGASPRLDTGIQPYANRQELQITAHVTRDGRLQQGSFNEIKQTLDVETENIEPENVEPENAATEPVAPAIGQYQAVHSGIRLSIYSPRA